MNLLDRAIDEKSVTMRFSDVSMPQLPRAPRPQMPPSSRLEATASAPSFAGSGKKADKSLPRTDQWLDFSI
ncbi:hypothetical protein [Cupriavidus consociatus]|uniref:hypothetical protein n=1 Tax=Cupriavidus consociatus TaxID=2821357 RepID=UPI001AE1190C|nr:MULTISPECIES: hypothetical protein [unclassified Cupriavidus]MBP0623143.1 hypothetical protein [Cupriavidus sp. LEh25]MDK2659837.1 hypothetical protein [Cupriavidus sp. LEh21]